MNYKYIREETRKCKYLKGEPCPRVNPTEEVCTNCLLAKVVYLLRSSFP